MWPMLLDMTRDDCRRTLRRLELEAYSSMISVFRAQGPLADDRKKLLEDIRGALNISSDRHTAEARRASNDELLATIAEQLSGPNTGLGWACEGRRKIPILPRGVPQTMYTAIADKAASIASEENEKLAQKIHDQKVLLVSPKSPTEGSQDMELDESTAATGDSTHATHSIKTKASEGSHPTIVLWDQSLKVANDEGPPRKRSRSDCAPPQHHRATHQRYLNISQIYSNYSKTPSGKVSNQYGKNSYSQGGKMSGKMSGKSNHAHTPKIMKHRSLQGKHGSGGKHSGQVTIPHHQVRSGIKSPTDPHIVGSQALNIQNPIDTNTLKSQTSGFQANFAQSLLQNSIEESDIKQLGSTNILESPTMQLLTQAPIPQEALTTLTSSEDLGGGITHNRGMLSPSHGTTGLPSISKIHQNVSGKPCHLIIKKKTDNTGDNTSSSKIQVTSMQIISKPSEMSAIKVLQNRQVVVAPPHNPNQKILSTCGKLLTTKIVQQIPQKSLNTAAAKCHTPNSVREKVLIVSKSPVSSNVQPSILQRSLSNTTPKNVIISSHSNLNPAHKDGEVVNRIDNIVDSDSAMSKGIAVNNSDMKLQTKTFLVNPKSGQKMVVVPAKARAKGALMGQGMPLLQVKGMPGRTTMKFVPVSSQSINSQTKSSNITVVSKPTNSNILTTKIISKDSLGNMKPISPNSETSNKLSSNVQIASMGSNQTIIRPAGKGNVILVQKTNTLGKGAITFTKNGNDLSKLVMSSKMTPVTSQPSVTLPKVVSAAPEVSPTTNVNKNSGNVILLEVSNEQVQHPTNLTEFLEVEEAATTLTPVDPLDHKSERAIITEDTPVLFHNQLSDDVCNADSMESTTDSLMEVVHMEDAIKSNDSFTEDQELQKLNDDSKVAKDNQAATVIASDWDMECSVEENISDKEKSINKSDELRLELESSSDSDSDGYIESTEGGGKRKHPSQDDGSPQRDQRNADESNELYVKRSSINQAGRTLLSQLQDEGSSSNDSPFVLAKSLGKTSGLLNKFSVQTESNAQMSGKTLNKSEELPLEPSESSPSQLNTDVPSDQACSIKSESQSSRMDIFSTAIASADINLDSYEYLEDGIMSGEDMFHLAGGEHVKAVSATAERGVSLPDKDKHHQSLEQQINQLLNKEHNIDAARLEVESSVGSGAME